MCVRHEWVFLDSCQRGWAIASFWMLILFDGCNVCTFLDYRFIQWTVNPTIMGNTSSMHIVEVEHTIACDTTTFPTTRPLAWWHLPAPISFYKLYCLHNPISCIRDCHIVPCEHCNRHIQLVFYLPPNLLLIESLIQPVLHCIANHKAYTLAKPSENGILLLGVGFEGFCVWHFIELKVVIHCF